MSEVYRGAVTILDPKGEEVVIHGKTYSKPGPAKAWVTLYCKNHTRSIIVDRHVERAVEWKPIEGE